MTFFDIAKPMAERGVPQIRVRPNSKAAFDKDWPSLATTDLQRLAALSAELPIYIAKPMAERGVPQIRVRPNSKAAFDKDWPSLATTDLQRLAALSAELPN